MGNLQGINLSDNKIVNLNENLFNHVKTCRSIYLCNNKIEKLEKNVFKNLEKIEIIDLYNNKISDLSEADVFENLNKLDPIPGESLNQYDVVVDSNIDLEQVGTVKCEKEIGE